MMGVKNAIPSTSARHHCHMTSGRISVVIMPDFNRVKGTRVALEIGGYQAAQHNEQSNIAQAIQRQIEMAKALQQVKTECRFRVYFPTENPSAKIVGAFTISAVR